MNTQNMLDRALVLNGIDCSEEQKAALLHHLDLVLQKNGELNLTRIDSVEEGIELHIVDSLIGLQEFESCSGNLFVDLGSGAGFPGIPLALCSGAQGTLVDSVKKKALALQGFIDTLDLTGTLEASDKRAEELALERPNSFAVVTARAVTTLPSLVELASPLLNMGGHLIAYKGTPNSEEREGGDAAAERCGLKCVSIRECELKPSRARRTILVYEKVSEPALSLPRRIGKAQKSPLA